MTALTDGYLFIGGPAHKRWIAVPKGQTSVRVPVSPARPTIWQEGDALFARPEEHLYILEDVNIFGRRAVVMMDRNISFPERSEALADALLSDDGKAVRQ